MCACLRRALAHIPACMQLAPSQRLPGGIEDRTQYMGSDTMIRGYMVCDI